MKKFSFGDIVLLKFPFTDGKTFKKRPALIINDFDDGDIIVCRITSQLYYSDYDFLIKNWEKCGLKLPSVIRIHKIATLEKSLIEILLGKIDSPLKKEIKNIFSSLPDK